MTRRVFCDVTIPGQPQAKARAVPVVNHKRLYAWARGGCQGAPPRPRMVTAPRTAQWETLAAWLCRRACPDRPAHTGPIGAEISAVLQRPQRLTKPAPRVPAPVAPDADNVAKIALDAAVKAGVIEDDRRITSLFVRTEYAAIGEAPHLLLILFRDDSGVNDADDDSARR